MTREPVVAGSPRGRVVLGAAAVTTAVRRSAESVDGVPVETGVSLALPATGEQVQAAVAAALEAAVGTRSAVEVTIDGVHP